MDKFYFLQFYALLRREIQEHRHLFIGAPAILALLLLVFAIWVLNQLEGEDVAAGVEYLAMLFEGLSPIEMAPLIMPLAIPFNIVLYVCAVVYLVNTLYQDRKDGSVLFWQSMPVSNLQTVLSKVVTIMAVAPLFYIAVISALYFVSIILLSLVGLSQGVQIAGLGYLLMAALVSLLLIYLSTVLTALWLLPTMGWFLLFSAYSKRVPLMAAIGIFILLGFVEDLVFKTQYFANWVESRSDPNQYILFNFSDVADRLFNYDMLFGIFVGAILITGAVYMRRFTD